MLPRVTGAGWTDIWATLRTLTLPQVALLVGLWFLSLVAYSWVLTGALPGLTHGQAVTLNLSGSAVSNVVPFGGALGIGLNYAMARSFGFRRSSFVSAVAVTGLVNVLARLGLPLLGLLSLLASGRLPSRGLVLAAAVGAVVLAVITAAVIGALASDRVADAVTRTIDAAGGLALRLARSARTVDTRHAVYDLRERSAALLRRGWRSMSWGLLGFFGMQALLLWTILHMLGSTIGPAAVFAAFTFGRLLTTVVVTPSGVGIAETGSAALLIALGGDPAISAAGMLLLGGFTYLIEIPAGAVCAAIWWRKSSWRRPLDSMPGEAPSDAPSTT